VGKIAVKVDYRSVFLTISHCILSAELIKTHSFRVLFWRLGYSIVVYVLFEDKKYKLMLLMWSIYS